VTALTRTRPSRNGTAPTPPATVRVAVYTRKSTEEGLDQEFNSLEAQREAVEAYAKSQRGQGWEVLPDHYDDGGFTGANTDRPAFQRLLKDVEAGRVDVVAVYKIDRLSRSLLDFVRIMEQFQALGVTFVSVTQQFNTTTPVGRLTLNLLATFAQFEREVISERTRDKIAATRRKGLYTGGPPVLGYDVVDKKLVVNAAEAEQVREVFRLYLEVGTLAPTAAELGRRGIRTKTRTTRKGRLVPGRAFDKNSLHQHLTNVLYAGRVRLKKETFPGQHEAIIDQDTWDAVQRQLKNHGRTGGTETKNKWGVLLRGLLFCAACGRGMCHHWTSRGERRYSYYVCQSHLSEGAAACPGSRTPTRVLEAAVVDHLRQLGRDPELVARTVQAARDDVLARRPEVEAERRRLDARLAELRRERQCLLDAIAQGGPAGRVLQDRLATTDQEAEEVADRLADVRAELRAKDAGQIDEDDLRQALEAFDPVWDQLFPREKARILALLLERVTVSVKTEEVSLTFRPGGVRALNRRRTG
jgi:site-specific DNA recombinase